MAVGGLAGVVIIVGLGLVLYRHHRKMKELESKMSGPFIELDDSHQVHEVPTKKSDQKAPVVPLQELDSYGPRYELDGSSETTSKKTAVGDHEQTR